MTKAISPVISSFKSELYLIIIAMLALFSCAIYLGRVGHDAVTYYFDHLVESAYPGVVLLLVLAFLLSLFFGVALLGTAISKFWYHTDSEKTAWMSSFAAICFGGATAFFFDFYSSWSQQAIQYALLAFTAVALFVAIVATRHFAAHRQ